MAPAVPTDETSGREDRRGAVETGPPEGAARARQLDAPNWRATSTGKETRMIEGLVFLLIVVIFAVGMALALYADGLPKRVRRRDGRDRERERDPRR